jgi:hypothetical protein
MIMPKYTVLKRLWSESKKIYIEPGETYECSDEDAIILLRKKCIKPAEYKRRRYIKKINEVKENDTNN